MLDTYISNPVKVNATIYDGINGLCLPGFKVHRDTFNHAVFSRNIDGTGTLIVNIGDYLVYFPNGVMKSYSPEQFNFLFTKEDL